MELEFFSAAGHGGRVVCPLRAQARYDWIRPLRLRPRADACAHTRRCARQHYARGYVDVEYPLSVRLGQLECIATVADFDLRVHEEASGRRAALFDTRTRREHTPRGIERRARRTRSSWPPADAYRRGSGRRARKQTRACCALPPGARALTRRRAAELRKRPPLVALPGGPQAMRRQIMVDIRRDWASADSIAARKRSASTTV